MWPQPRRVQGMVEHCPQRSVLTLQQTELPAEPHLARSTCCPGSLSGLPVSVPSLWSLNVSCSHHPSIRGGQFPVGPAGQEQMGSQAAIRWELWALAGWCWLGGPEEPRGFRACPRPHSWEGHGWDLDSALPASRGPFDGPWVWSPWLWGFFVSLFF